MKDIIICDIDGTVANLDHRLSLVKNGNHQWDRFFAAVSFDKPIKDIIDFVTTLVDELNYSLYFVSGRPERTRIDTEAWLEANVCDYVALYMRKDKDCRPDDIIKTEIFNQYFADRKDRVFMVIDDRPRVIRGWKALGLNVLDVGHGIEF